MRLFEGLKDDADAIKKVLGRLDDAMALEQKLRIANRKAGCDRIFQAAFELIAWTRTTRVRVSRVTAWLGAALLVLGFPQIFRFSVPAGYPR